MLECCVGWWQHSRFPSDLTWQLQSKAVGALAFPPRGCGALHLTFFLCPVWWNPSIKLSQISPACVTSTRFMASLPVWYLILLSLLSCNCMNWVALQQHPFLQAVLVRPLHHPTCFLYYAETDCEWGQCWSLGLGHLFSSLAFDVLSLCVSLTATPIEPLWHSDSMSLLLLLLPFSSIPRGWFKSLACTHTHTHTHTAFCPERLSKTSLLWLELWHREHVTVYCVYMLSCSLFPNWIEVTIKLIIILQYSTLYSMHVLHCSHSCFFLTHKQV